MLWGDGREALAREGHLGAEGGEQCPWEESKLPQEVLPESLEQSFQPLLLGVALLYQASRTLSSSPGNPFLPEHFALLVFADS